MDGEAAQSPHNNNNNHNSKSKHENISPRSSKRRGPRARQTGFSPVFHFNSFVFQPI